MTDKNPDYQLAAKLCLVGTVVGLIGTFALSVIAGHLVGAFAVPVFLCLVLALVFLQKSRSR